MKNFVERVFGGAIILAILVIITFLGRIPFIIGIGAFTFIGLYEMKEVLKKININIPTLCHMYMVDGKTRNCKGTCRVCLVEIEGKEGIVPACATEIREGMSVKTNSLKAIKARRTITELLLSNHPMDCLKCEKNNKCELQSLASELGIFENYYEGERNKYDLDISDSFVRDRE